MAMEAKLLCLVLSAWLTGVVAWGFPWPGLTAQASEGRKVLVAHSAPDALAPIILFLGKERGYFAGEGINPVFMMAKTTLAIKALMVGEVKFTMSATQATKAAVQGAQVKTVFSVSNRSLFWLHARPEVKSIMALKGKVIGIDALGSGPHIAIAAMLREAGLDPNRDVIFKVSGAGMARFAAFKAGSIDAIATTTSTFAPAEREGFTNLGFAGRLDKKVSAGIVTSDRLIREDPALVKGFVKAMVKGIKHFKARREDGIAIMAKVSERPADETAILYDAVRQILDDTGIPEAEAIQETIEMAVQETGAKRSIPVQLAYDLRFVQEANRELKAAGWRP